MCVFIYMDLKLLFFSGESVAECSDQAQTVSIELVAARQTTPRHATSDPASSEPWRRIPSRWWVVRRGSVYGRVC